MSLKSFLAKPFARYITNRYKSWNKAAIQIQDNLLHGNIHMASSTTFGKDHSFSSIRTHDDFKKAVPLGDYEQMRPYIDNIIAGEKDVLWPGAPIYFAKTSGTTSGIKYIPISKDSISNHILTARNTLLAYVYRSGNHRFVDGKMIFLSGSPELEKVGGILTGRLSGIVNHHVPRYMRNNQLPDYQTNCIKDWEEKLDKIVDLTLKEDMALISGIPPWVQMYYDRLMERSGKPVGEIFPLTSYNYENHLSLLP